MRNENRRFIFILSDSVKSWRANWDELKYFYKYSPGGNRGQHLFFVLTKCHLYGNIYLLWQEIVRIIIPNIPYHVTQRGNYRQVVFDTNNDRMQYLSLIKIIDDWGKYLDITEEEGMLNRIRGCTSTGRPAGDETFATRLEELLGRVLRPKDIGRPRK